MLPDGNIKGNLVGPVTVIQLGGVDSDGTTRLFEDDSLLALNSTYLFVTRVAVLAEPDEFDSASASEAAPPPAGGVLGLVAPGYDHELVESDAERQQLEDRFVSAYQNEIDPFAENQ